MFWMAHPKPPTGPCFPKSAVRRKVWDHTFHTRSIEVMLWHFFFNFFQLTTFVSSPQKSMSNGGDRWGLYLFISLFKICLQEVKETQAQCGLASAAAVESYSGFAVRAVWRCWLGPRYECSLCIEQGWETAKHNCLRTPQQPLTFLLCLSPKHSVYLAQLGLHLNSPNN